MIKKDNNFGYVKSLDPNIEIDEGILVKDSLLSEISFNVKAYAEVINPVIGEVIVTTVTEINIIKYYCSRSKILWYASTYLEF